MTFGERVRTSYYMACGVFLGAWQLDVPFRRASLQAAASFGVFVVVDVLLHQLAHWHARRKQPHTNHW